MAKKKIATEPFDPAEFLTTDEAIVAYLEDALEEGDPAAMLEAIGVVARVRGMSKIARDTALGRESLYKSLSADGNPEFRTVLSVLKALGASVSVEAIREPAA